MSDEYYGRVFSNNLKRYMNLSGKSQVDLINDLGFTRSAVSTWVNGTRIPRVDKVDTLAKYFGISRSDLTEDKTSLISDTASEDSRLFMKIKSLPSEKRKLLEQMIDSWL